MSMKTSRGHTVRRSDINQCWRYCVVLLWGGQWRLE